MLHDGKNHDESSAPSLAGAAASVKIPKTVWALGLVSLFMDVSSEIIHALLPLFLTTTLGASVALVGLIDGVAEATASISKIFSGYISDRIGRRKPLILLGYGLGALSKPLFAIAGSASVVLGARFADRIGKGLRGAPRDALVADMTPIAIRGRAFGLRQSLDTVGAFLGPLLAIGLMLTLANNIRAVFWVAIIPGVVAVLLVLFGVEDRRGSADAQSPVPVRTHDLLRLDRAFWGVVAIGVVFTLARFSEAFLILKANAEGLPLALAPLVLVVMNIVYALGAYPAGAWSDRVPAARLLLWGLACLIAADIVIAFTSGIIGAFVGIALWGAHMAMTQGLFAKLVADHAPPELRGSAYGVFNLATGLALLAASVIAGVLWDRWGSSATFAAGAAFAGLAFLLLACRRNTSGQSSDG
ncbi:MFS transporter [Sphingomonas canadensis]|uniref:MFS transporter n=1 Tax=Sphingomonas canadensis TaxID=1219257 RepID=A0ABW3HA16_9SPHN|nr:MFS transporter [Sphingomonas canadensis]MCW3837217.1 MFS transporter [Sphingomonas canadensis]